MKNIFRHTAIVIIALLISISAFGQTSPANDLCNNSISLEILPTIEKCVVSSNQFATSNGNSNICDAMPAGNEVWYNFVTLGDSTKISVKPSGVSPITDLSVSVYTGNNCKALTLWNCFSASGNGAVTFDYLDAKGKFIWLEIESNGSDGDFELCVMSEDHIIVGNQCSEAATICDKESIYVPSLNGYTSSGATICSNTAKQDAWIKFTVGQNGKLEFIITPNSSTEFDWALFDITDGCVGAGATQISCNYNLSSFFLNCNILGAPTGALPLAVSSGQPCPGEFTTPSNVFANRTYAVIIDNYNNNNDGFTFEWANGSMQLDAHADFDISPNVSCTAPALTTITNNSAGLIKNYSYNLDDGTSGVGSSIPLSHTYQHFGDYMMSVVVESDSGRLDVMAKRVNMNSGPIVNLEPQDTAICGRDSFLVRSEISFGTPTLPTFYFNNTVELIPDPPPADLGITKTIAVSGISPATLRTGTITDVCFTISHTSHSDITELTLESPDGAVFSYSNLPLSGAGTQNYCFNDSNLYNFTGNTNGNWSLYIEDNVDNAIDGNIDSFSFNINYDNTINSVKWSNAAIVSDSNSVTPYIILVSPTVISLTPTDQLGCNGRDTLSISQVANPFAIFNVIDTVCYGDSSQIEVALNGTKPFDFTYFDGATPTTILSHDSSFYVFKESTAKQFTISNISDSVCIGFLRDTMNFSPLDSVKIDTVRLPCNVPLTKYTVEIDIFGSDSNLYKVTGGPGTIVMGNPTKFVSDSILHGSSYSFFVSDSLDCNSILVDGTRNCKCDASANISGGDTICDGDSLLLSVDLIGVGPWNLYYSNQGNSYSAMAVASSPFTFFAKDSGYYRIDSISDFNCTSPGSDSTLMTLTQAPTATLTGGDTICFGQSLVLNLKLTGAPSWSFTLDSTAANPGIPYVLSSSTHSFTVQDSGTYEIKLLSDKNCAGFDLGLAQKVVILEPDTAEFTYSDSAYCENSANQLPIFTASSDLGGSVFY